MLPSLFLAAIFGPYLVIAGLALLVNPKRGPKLVASFSKNDGLIWFAGVFLTLFGTFLVHIHNIWVKGWPVVITLIVWLILLKGVFLLLFPGLTDKSVKYFKKSTTFFMIAGLIALLLGAFLSYMGYSLYFAAPVV